jgi:uncharacterized cupin superfamily protein
MQFLSPIQFCYDSICSRVLVPWTSEFEELGDHAGLAVLSQPSGEFKQGMYVKIAGFWGLVLNYEDLCSILSDNSAITVTVGLSSPVTIPGTATAYRNGYKVPGLTELTPGPNIIWAVASAPNSGSGSGTIPLTDMFGTHIGDFVVA